MSEGCVYLVGGGPGDPGLLTVRGRELLEQADVVVYDYLSSPRLLDHAPPDAERIYVGKKAADHTLSQEGINQLLVDKARAGAVVVRLKGGDPYVFGRGGEEALALVRAGIAFEVVPGVTAGVAAPAYAGIPVTHRHVASCFGLVTGHETPDKDDSDLDWQALADWTGTLAFYMGVRNLPIISEGLIAKGKDPETPVALIRWGTRSRQEVVTGTLTTIVDRVREAGLKPPAIILVGEVVRLREELNWFERRPLFGRRIVVTRSREQASALTARLEALGAEAIELPTIRVEPPEDPEPLRRMVEDVSTFDWVILASVNSVRALFDGLAAIGRDARALATCKVAAVGPVTAARLAEYGVRADCLPPKYTSSSVVEALAAIDDLAGKRILMPRADIAPGDLPDALANHDAIPVVVTAYRTVPEDVNADQVKELLGEDVIDWITFTSSSTVRNLFSILDPDAVRAGSVRMASIGPLTSATLAEFGMAAAVEAQEHTIPGLVDAIVARETTQKEEA